MLWGHYPLMMFLGKSETSSPPTLQFSPEGEPATLQPVQAGALQAAGTEEVCPALAASYDPKLNPGGGGDLQSSSSLTSPAPRGLFLFLWFGKEEGHPRSLGSRAPRSDPVSQ